MKSDNYIAFAVVCGFFLGLIFGFIAFEEVEFMILFTLIVTAVFYLIVVLGISAFYWFMDFETQKFNKNRLEENLEFYINQFGKKEKELKDVLQYLRNFELNQETRGENSR